MVRPHSSCKQGFPAVVSGTDRCAEASLATESRLAHHAQRWSTPV